MKQKLKIAQVAPMWFSIPPKKYGGTERIIHYLTEELQKRGHKVTLFAPGDSKTSARLVAFLKKGAISLGAKWPDYWWNLINHSIAFERADEFDIIHCHWGIMGAFFQRLVKTPVVHTMHNIPQASHMRWKVFEYYKNDLNLVFISKSEMRNSPMKFKNSWVVYNGIDISQFKFNPKPKDHFVWIGRVSPAKGIENAIKVAKKLKLKLLLAGQIQPSWRNYFETVVKPQLDSRIKYIGEISQRQLSKFYREAKALLYPIEWEEPFGLVMVEAMACGTPVIVFERGSAKEVVKDGKTGFVVPFKDKRGRKNINGLVEAVKKIDQIKREDCRKWVEENFTYQKMVDGYEKVYYQILKQHKLL